MRLILPPDIAETLLKAHPNMHKYARSMPITELDMTSTGGNMERIGRVFSLLLRRMSRFVVAAEVGQEKQAEALERLWATVLKRRDFSMMAATGNYAPESDGDSVMDRKCADAITEALGRCALLRDDARHHGLKSQASEYGRLRRQILSLVAYSGTASAVCTQFGSEAHAITTHELREARRHAENLFAGAMVDQVCPLMPLPRRPIANHRHARAFAFFSHSVVRSVAPSPIADIPALSVPHSHMHVDDKINTFPCSPTEGAPQAQP